MRRPVPQMAAVHVLSKLGHGLRVLFGLKQSNIRFRPIGWRPVRRAGPVTRIARSLPSASDVSQIDVRDLLERGSMILEGLRQLAAYQSGSVIAPAVRSIPGQAVTVVQSVARSMPEPTQVPAFAATVMQQTKPLPEVTRVTSDTSVSSPSPTKSESASPVTPLSATAAPPVRTERHLSSYSRESHVPATRIGRITSFGSLVASLGIGSLAEASKRTFGLSESKDKPLFLSDANINRIVETLCKVRGAALKLGQIISIQDEAIVSPEIAAAFERVRQSADFMPIRQMRKVMRTELGDDWQEKYFLSFSERPFAAASIGQVHEAVLKDGSNVAVKIQYPGVAEGIESDIRNLVMIMRVWKIFPDGVFLDQLMRTARLELNREVDYEREAESQIQYSKFIEPYAESMRIRVPRVYPDISTKRVFVTELINGLPIDRFFKQQPDTPVLSQEKRNDIAARLLRLTLKEVFEFRFMQTDPNFSNYFYEPETDTLSLLDFGASREYSADFISIYFKLIKAAADQDDASIVKYSREIGFLTGFESKVMEEAHTAAVRILGEAFAVGEEFDFGSQSTSRKIARLIPVMINHRLVPPPEETYSLHRKMSGMFLLSSKLKAKVNCREIYDQECERFLSAQS